MRFINWAESFREKPIIEDIPRSVQKTEIIYWVFLAFSTVILVIGLVILLLPIEDVKANFIGLFLALEGSLNIMLMKIYAHIRLAMYRIIWDNKNRIEYEIRKSEAADL